MTYNGSSYVTTAAVAANGNTPDQTPASWSLIAAAGATGPAGPTGPQGPIGPQGPSGTATITLTSICSALTGSATSAALASLGCAVSSWPVGGTVSGYSSGTLILTYNGGSPLTITGNGAFSFGSEPTGSSYTVAIQTQPAGYACSVAGGATGTVSSSSASAVTLTCAALAPISFSGFEGVGGLASDGTYLWVSVEGTYNTQGQQITDSMLEKIDPNTSTVLASVPIGYQNGSVAFDGTNLWAIGHASASGSSGQVTLVNAATGNVTATYPVGTNPNSLAFDGTLMWICGGDGNVYALTSSGTIQYTVNLGTSSTAGQGLVRFDGARDIYVGEPQSGAIAKIDTTTGTENGLYTVTGPYGLTVAPVGSEDLWYPNSAGNLVELQAGGGDPTLFTSTYFVGDVTSDGVDVFTYSGTTVEVIDPSTTQTVNTYSGSAISYPDKVIYDGKSNVWVVNSNATIAKLPAVPGQ